VRLTEAPKGVMARVTGVEATQAVDPIARRLRDLGFVRDEPVRVVAWGPFGAEPVLVQVGATRFALRRAEANRVQVELVDAPTPALAGASQ
jgi:ferrous iron transport protein A